LNRRGLDDRQIFFSSRIDLEVYNDKILNFVFYPIRAGLFGFALFFTILMFAKLFGYVANSYNNFAIDVEDISLSGLGFILVFLVRFLANFREKQKNK